MKNESYPKSNLNKEWHQAHIMPKNATFEQRVAWHEEHIQNCLCRAPPASIAAIIAKKKLVEK